MCIESNVSEVYFERYIYAEENKLNTVIERNTKFEYKIMSPKKGERKISKNVH